MRTIALFLTRSYKQESSNARNFKYGKKELTTEIIGLLEELTDILLNGYPDKQPFNIL